MTPQEKANELVYKFFTQVKDYQKLDSSMSKNQAKQCALIAVDYIITSNPHSNPLNTEVYSTMNYWKEVKQEIEKL